MMERSFGIRRILIWLDLPGMGTVFDFLVPLFDVSILEMALDRLRSIFDFDLPHSVFDQISRWTWRPRVIMSESGVPSLKFLAAQALFEARPTLPSEMSAEEFRRLTGIDGIDWRSRVDQYEIEYDRCGFGPY